MVDLVSVILTTHNRADILPRAIDSILNQTYGKIELIIVDDGSVDNTEMICNEYCSKHQHVRYEKLAISQGACAARNKGILQAKGKFVIGLDDDDAYHPSRVEKLVQANSEEFAFIASWTMRKAINGKIRTNKIPKILSFEDYKWRNPGTSFPLILKERIVKVGLFDIGLKAAQDYDMWFRLMKAYKQAYVVQEPLYIIYDEEIERISTSNGKYDGRSKFVQKHKEDFSVMQMKYHSYYLKKLRKEPILFKEWMSSVPNHLRKQEFSYLIRSYLG